MKTFNVWVRPLGESCRVRVDGMDNTVWLVRRLTEAFVFKSFEPIGETIGSALCTFKIPFTDDLSARQFAQVLRAIPEIKLMHEPA